MYTHMTEYYWLGVVVGAVPLLGFVVWWWNELRYVLPLRLGANERLPPGHMGFPVIGDMMAFLWYFKFLNSPDDYINAKRRKYGDGVGMLKTHLFGEPSIIAYVPSVNKFVFQSDDKFRLEWPRPAVDLVGASSLVASHGKEHTRIRSFVINAVNHPNALRRIALLIQPRLVAALQSWAQRPKIKAQLETKKVIRDNIGKLFGSIEEGPVLENLDDFFEDVLKGLRVYPRINFPGFTYHRALQSRKKAEQIFRNELEKRKQRNKNSYSSDDEVATHDLMDGLMQMQDEQGNHLSDKEIVDNIVTLVVGGYASTAIASMWAIYYLAKFPNVLSKLREENMALKNTMTGDFVTSEQVSKLEYTNKVVEETLRMTNVSAFLFRKIIKNAEYKGYKIPKGWNMLVWLRYIHTNPENFEDPMCFNPERWNESVTPGTYQVFGGGSRMCAGNKLARLQLAILLHHLSTGYKWELVNSEAGIIYLPHPAPVDGVEVFFTKL